MMHVEHGKALDVGCGSGDFLYFLHLYGWETSGIEPDERAARICSNRGIKTIHSDAENAVLPDNYFDAITLHHSLEHMRSPAAAVTRLAKALKPGGRLVVVTPNAAGFPARRFGPYWRSLDPPRHIALATPQALQLTMERAGLAVNIRTTSKTVCWNCRASIALRDGGSLRFQPSRWAVLAFTLASKVVAAFNPIAGEEIICIATKGRLGAPY
jgi:SAM-dependent methyltransferase